MLSNIEGCWRCQNPFILQNSCKYIQICYHKINILENNIIIKALLAQAEKECTYIRL